MVAITVLKYNTQRTGSLREEEDTVFAVVIIRWYSKKVRRAFGEKPWVGALRGGIQQNQPHGVLSVFFVFCTGKQSREFIFFLLVIEIHRNCIFDWWLLWSGYLRRESLQKLVVPVFETCCTCLRDKQLVSQQDNFFWNPFYVYLFNLRSQFPFGNCYLWVATVGFVLLGVLVDSGIRRNILFYYFVEVDIYWLELDILLSSVGILVSKQDK